MQLWWQFSQTLRNHVGRIASSKVRSLNSKTTFTKYPALLLVPSRNSTSVRLQRRSVGTVFSRREDMTMYYGNGGWHTIGDYKVYAWSVSGFETCVVVSSNDLKVAFDMGYSIPESISCNVVFISHGHLDHIGGVANHVAKRGLLGLKKARYFVPPVLVDNLRAVTEASRVMAQTTEALEDVHILPFPMEDTVQVSGRFSMRAFPTVHRIPSQGYILYKTDKKLKAEFVGRPASEIAQLNRDNVDINDVVCTPELAYTGDTMFDVFLDPPTPDLLKVKVLIMEATFLDTEGKKKNKVELARDRGHTHLKEISDNAHLFKDVDTIVLMHFSNTYSADFVHEFVSANIAPELKDKVICATIAKEKTS